MRLCKDLLRFLEFLKDSFKTLLDSLLKILQMQSRLVRGFLKSSLLRAAQRERDFTEHFPELKNLAKLTLSWQNRVLIQHNQIGRTQNFKFVFFRRFQKCLVYTCKVGKIRLPPLCIKHTKQSRWNRKWSELSWWKWKKMER